MVALRNPGHAADLDAFIGERLALALRRLAIDAVALGLAVMHLARLFGEFLADIVAILLDRMTQRAQLLHDRRLRMHRGDLLRWCRGCRRLGRARTLGRLGRGDGLRWPGAAAAGDQAWCHRGAADLEHAAFGASDL